MIIIQPVPVQFIFFGQEPANIVRPANPGQYRLLEDHYILNHYIPAGSTIIEGVDVPFGWIPTPNVDPLNTQAVQEFYNAGPGRTGQIVSQFSVIQPPITYWAEVAPDVWGLTGLGSNRTQFPTIGGLEKARN